MKPETWRDRAACVGTPVEVFFPGDGGNLAPARAICARCPVTTDCLDEALSSPDIHGTWAGTSLRERDALRLGRPIPKRQTSDDRVVDALARWPDRWWTTDELSPIAGISSKSVLRVLARLGDSVESVPLTHRRQRAYRLRQSDVEAPQSREPDSVDTLEGSSSASLRTDHVAARWVAR